MRKLIFCIVSVAALALALASCNKELRPGGDSTLIVNWESAGATKAAPEGSEGVINSLVIYVFDHNGMLDIAHTCTSEEVTAKSATVEVKTGQKTIYAVANLLGTPLAAANACTTLAALKAVTLSLSDNTTSNFVMVGYNTKDHQSATASTPVSLALFHPVAKVRLGTVSNNLPAPYGSMTVKQVFLCNVVGNQSLGFQTAPASPAQWLNKSGTDGDGSDKSYTIGRGTHAAACPTLTYHGLNEAVALGGTYTFNRNMYAMPNASTGDINGYPAVFSATATVMMVVVTILGTDYYYPIKLNNGTITSLAYNTEYTVNLNVKGLGNTYEDGPFTKIVKESLTATVSVTPWSDITPYTEMI